MVRAKQVINGSFGEVWVNGDYMAEITGCEANVEMEYEDINTPRKLSTGKKLLGWEGNGSLSFNKVTSRFVKLVAEDLKAGRQTEVDIISKLDDPDALGAERVVFKNSVFEGLTLANWEAKATGEEDTSFFFDDFDMLDLID